MKILKLIGALLLVILLVVVIIIAYNRNQNRGSDTDINVQTNTQVGQQEAEGPGRYTKTITSDNRTRTYHLYVPKGYTPEKSYPVVFLLHGGDGEGGLMRSQVKESGAERMLTNTGFILKADAESFILVAPEGIDGNWNDGRGQTEPERDGVDDVRFIANLLESLQNTYAVDAARVYATGVSNGSMLSQRLACELPQTFAAVGLVSGTIPKPIMSTCEASLSVVGIQGSNDPFAPIADSDGTFPESKLLSFVTGGNEYTATAEEGMAFWVKELGCDASATKTKLKTVVQDNTFVTQHIYTNCDNGNDLVYYIVDGMGHGWPPNENPATVKLAGPTSKNIIATDVIWDFFKTHSR